MIETQPTEHEVRSNMEAYASPPWGEILDYAETRDYMKHMHEHEDGFVITYSEDPGKPPYLYVHGMNYKDDVDTMIDENFAGNDAFYAAQDRGKIESALEGCGNVTYISNIHAAKDVDISEDRKPRLKVLPDLLETLFTDNQSDTIVLFTHRETGVFRTVTALDPEKFQVQSVPYDITSSPDKPYNENHKVDYLELMIIKQAEATASA